ncbi:hypothetical protein FK220_019320 [Flavobacteriaceae bacterium TP-CH-4]|uniref:Uncharacterized protein n=1 Tax=Pelagihabitans pacificus TaxID=2696054 RepID=A0A967B1Q8_9FLAO|nr:hypothetical protein [Pelagihabitans pacificus]NHF61512.1 hypothetical protein [Pelagihabitans pacificus]
MNSSDISFSDGFRGCLKGMPLLGVLSLRFGQFLGSYAPRSGNHRFGVYAYRITLGKEQLNQLILGRYFFG